MTMQVDEAHARPNDNNKENAREEEEEWLLSTGAVEKVIRMAGEKEEEGPFDANAPRFGAGARPLLHAYLAARGKVEEGALRALLAAGCDPDLAHDGETPLFVAFARCLPLGDEAGVRRLAAVADVRAAAPALLRFAARCIRPGAVALVLALCPTVECAADDNLLHVPFDHNLALYREGGHLAALLRALLRVPGQAVDQRDGAGCTALHRLMNVRADWLPAEAVLDAAAVLLYEGGANPGARNARGHTPLDRWLRLPKDEAVGFMLRRALAQRARAWLPARALGARRSAFFKPYQRGVFLLAD